MRISLFAIALPLVLAGCQAETFGADDIAVDPSTVTLVGGVAFAGGILTLQAPAFAELAEGPVSATIGGMNTVALPHAAGSDLVRVFVPGALRGGSVTLSLRLPNQSELSLGKIQVGGFAPMRHVLGSIEGTAQVLRRLPGIAATDLSFRPIVVDARNATVRTESISGSHYGVGATFEENTIVANVVGWRRLSWSQGTVRLDSTVFGYDSPLVHELAPGVTLEAAKGGYSYLHWGFLDGYGYPDHVAYSGDGHWAVPDHWNSDSGVLIWDRELGSSAWSPRWRRVRTGFLPNNTFVVAGTREGQPFDTTQAGWLARIDPATGTVLDSVQLDEEIGAYPSLGVTSQGWIVLSRARADTWEISIRDPSTLREVGRSSVELGVDRSPGGALLLVDDPLLHRWYLVQENQTDGPIAIATFLTP